MTPAADVPAGGGGGRGASPWAARLRCGMARSLYGLAWRLARPILRRNKRLAEGFSWRLVPPDWSGKTGSAERPGRVDVWIQAASGGEAYLAWEILERLADGAPLSALVTTWTRQGLEVLHGMAEKLRQSHPELAVRVTLFPLDQPSIMARALDQARPRAIALLETELWPGLLLAAADRHIPVFVLNGRMTEKSLSNYLRLERLCPGFWRGVAPRRTSAVSEADAGRFAALFGPERVDAAPNIKFDRCLPDSPLPGDSQPDSTRPDGAQSGRSETSPALSAAGREAAPPDRAARPLILLASVREEEEEALMTVIRRVRGPAAARRNGDAPTLVIAPRHMHRVSAWKERLAGMEGGFTLRSRLGSNPAGTNPPDTEATASPHPTGDAVHRVVSACPGGIILWDAFGELAALYAVADAVFVGGSLAPLGGQNFLEALAAGRTPCCGPHLENFAWVFAPAPGSTPDSAQGNARDDSLEKRGLLLTRHTPEQVAETLLDLAGHPLPPEEIRRRFLDWLTPRLGGSARCAALLHDVIRTPGDAEPPRADPGAARPKP